MAYCWAPNCKHNSYKQRCRFFELPKDVKLRRQWLKNIRKPGLLPKRLAICSCHFKDGDKKNVPDIFIRESPSKPSTKQFPPHYCSPESRTRRSSLVLKAPSTSMTSIRMFENIPSTSSGLPPTSTAIACEDLPSTSRCTELQEELSTTAIATDKSDDVIHSLSDRSATSSVVTEVENYFLEEKAKELEAKTRHTCMKNLIEELDDKTLLLYTGIPERKIFDALYDLLKDVEINYFLKHTVGKLTRKEQLFMTLMKLRQNFPYADLAYRFGVSTTIVGNVVITWIHILHDVLYKEFMSSIPSRNKNKTCLPNSFSTFTNCRIIIDCTEIHIMVPFKSLAGTKVTYSSDKHRNTLKGLVGVAPNGVITFVSNLYLGSTSDKKIVQKCGIINQLEAGDLILADKRFLIRDILPDGVHLNIPPFLHAPQFTQEQVQYTQKIARARIHVERAIRRMKCFKILNYMPYQLVKYSSTIFKTIGAITNLQYPLINAVEEYYDME